MDSLNDFGMSVEAPMTASETPGGDRDPPGNDQEKRLRREIANSNERRRMQSINAGFQSLRNLLPHHEGEKLSKAAILQQTAEYIHQLEQEKTRLMTQNSQLMKRYNNGGSSGAAANATSSSSSSTTGNNVVASQSGVFSSPHSPSTGDAPPAIIKRRKTLDGSVESADEGIGSMSPDHNGEEYRNEVAELRRETLALRMQLERERRHRLSLEDTLSNLRHQNAGQVEEQQRMILRREEEEEQQRQQQILERQQQQQQQQIIFVHQQPSATVQPVHVKFEEKMQTAEENEVYLRVPTPVRNPHDDHRVRHNLNSIVEAIRQLEGDHLFADDRSSSSNVAGTRATVSPPRASPPGAMEVCPSSSPLSSSHPHNLHPHHQRAALSVQPTTLTYHCSPEVPLSLTSSSVTPVAHHEPGQTSNGILVRPAYHHQPPPPPVPVSTTVTSLKHHVLNRLARSGEMDEPINLEYRPVSRSPSPPPPSHCIQQQQVHHLHHHQIEGTSQAATIAQFHIQQQLRPGVIVVKHS